MLVNILIKNLKIVFYILVFVVFFLVCWSFYFVIGVVEMYCVNCIFLIFFGNWLVSMMVYILGVVDFVIYIFFIKDFRKIIFCFFKFGNCLYFVSEIFYFLIIRLINVYVLLGLGLEMCIVDKD